MKTEYRVIMGYSESDLSEEVGRLLQQGWKCQGGVSGYTTSTIASGSYGGGAPRDHKTSYVQAMIRRVWPWNRRTP